MSRESHIRFLSYTARLYDPVATAMGFPRLWAAIAEAAAPVRGSRCLDVCTGTGGVALALARRGAETVGVDLSQGMLRRAAEKARAAGLDGRGHWLWMDARRLAFPDASFPVVTCSMALHEMSEGERVSVLAELRRVSSDAVVVADYRVPETPARRLLFRLRHAFEYLESDDFGSFARCDPESLLESAPLVLGRPRDAGRYRIWPCRVKP